MDLTPEERLLAALVRLAIRDATKSKDKRLQADALRWLWWVAPGVAERAGVGRSVQPIATDGAAPARGDNAGRLR